MECDLCFSPGILVTTVGKETFVGFCFEGFCSTAPVLHECSLLHYSLHVAKYKLA